MLRVSLVAMRDTLQYGEIYNFPQAVFEKALDDEEMDRDTEAGDEESASELEDEQQVRKYFILNKLGKLAHASISCQRAFEDIIVWGLWPP